MLGFTTFSILCVQPQNRLSIVGILLLTSVNFRWIITQRLPSVSYLTFLDKYAIGCILLLGFLFMWDAVVGSKVISPDEDFLKTLEKDVIYGLAGAFLLFLFLIIAGFTKLYVGLIFFNKRSQKAYMDVKLEKAKYISSISSSRQQSVAI
jgi:hypothetical protein